MTAVIPRHLRPHAVFGDDPSGWCGCAECEPRSDCGCPSCALPADGTERLDPRWEWHEVRRLCDVSPTYIRGSCRHVDVVPVESVITGEPIAHLCVTCDRQLPEEWKP